jgi:hypothetical protein
MKSQNVLQPIHFVYLRTYCWLNTAVGSRGCTSTNCRTISECWTGKCVERCDWRIIGRRNWSNPRKSSVKSVGLGAQIWSMAIRKRNATANHPMGVTPSKYIRQIIETVQHSVDITVKPVKGYGSHNSLTQSHLARSSRILLKITN